MKHTVVIERASNNYAAYVPDLPGSVATASAREELLEEPIPEPQATSDVVEVAAASGA